MCMCEYTEREKERVLLRQKRMAIQAETEASKAKRQSKLESSKNELVCSQTGHLFGLRGGGRSVDR